MSFFGMVFGIVFLGVVCGMFAIYMGNKKSAGRRGTDKELSSVSEALKRQKIVNADLEKRIQNLESIITSEDYDLDKKFKDL